MVMRLADSSVVVMVYSTAFCSVASKVAKMVTDWEREMVRLL